MLLPKPVDKVANRVSRILHEVRAERGRREVAHRVGLGLERSRWSLKLVAPGLDGSVFDDVETKADGHRTLDPGDANLTIALGAMAVAGREHRARHEDRKVELGADVQMPGVDVAGPFGGRQDIELTRLVRRDTHGSAERLERNPNRGAQRSALTVAEIEVADVRLREVFGQEAEARDQAGPAPFERAQLQHLHFEDVARLRSPDVDRTRERVQAIEVQTGQRRGRRSGLYLSVSDLHRLEMNDVPGLDFNRRCEAVVPLVVNLPALDRMFRATHLSSPQPEWKKTAAERRRVPQARPNDR